MAGRKIVIEFLGKDTSAGSTASAVEKKFGKLGGKLDKVGQLAGKTLAGGLLAGGAMMVKFGQQAGDLAETQSKVNQIFGTEGAAAMDKFASTAAKKLGQSKQAALDAVATFGMMGKSAGLEGKRLTRFSGSLTHLASDMASFSNTSPEEAVEALGAALRGEAEPIRKYGVMLDEGTLKAEAMSLGLVKASKDTDKIKLAQVRATLAQEAYNKAVKEHGKQSTEARRANASLMSSHAALKKATQGTIGPLTQRQKIMAAQSAILKQTSDQQGDFARTSDGLANKQRILKAQLTNFSTELGQHALPYMLKAVDVGLQMIKWVDENQRLVGTLAVGVGALAAVTYTVSAAMRAWVAITKVWAAVTKIAAAVQWALNAAMSANPIGLVILAVAGLVAGLVIAYKKSETFRKIVDAAFRAVTKAAMFAFNWVKAHWPLILAILTGPIGLATLAIVKNWDKIKAGGAKVIEFVRGIPGRLKDLAGKFGDAGRALINAFLGGLAKAGNFVSSFASGIWNAVKGMINSGIDRINSALEFKIAIPHSPDVHVNPPNIPHLAKGGIIPATPGGRLVRIAEAGHAEAVIPLSGPNAPRGGGDEQIVVQLVLDSKVIHQSLVKRKRTLGQSLGLS